MKNTSKLLSLVLRHAPDEIGLKLDNQGWVDVDILLEKLALAGHPLTRSGLQEVVDTNAKKRFSMSDNGKRIRAAQGHSINIDLALAPQEPPETLFHGTAVGNQNAILAEGLKAGRRQHVHLSVETDTAVKVGQRHGKPVVLTVAAGQMHRDGLLFYRSDNGVWLTDNVPPHYVKA